MNEQENIQVIKDIYLAFERGDIPTLLNALTQDVDWLFVGRPEDVPFAGPRHGQEQMMAFFSTIAQTVDVLAFEPHEIMAFDNHVLVLGHERLRIKSTNQVVDSDWAHLFRLQNGKVSRVQEFYDTASIAAAFTATDNIQLSRRA